MPEELSPPEIPEEISKTPFRSQFRSLRLYKTHQPTGLQTQFNKGTAFIPIAKSTADVCDFAKAIFGTAGYSTIIRRYYLPKRFLFANPYMPGKRIIETIPVADTAVFVKGRLPKLAAMPTYMVRDIGNTLYDLSPVFQAVVHDDSHFRKQPRYLKNADLFMPRILDHFIEPRFGTGLDYLSQLNIMGFNPVRVSGFKHVVIGINVEASNMKAIRPYLLPQTMVPLSVKKTVTMDLISILRFLIIAFDPEKVSHKDQTGVKDLAEHWRQSDTTIVFYNSKNFFYMNYNDLTKWGIKTAQDFRKRLGDRIMVLMKQNAGHLEEAVEEDDKTDVSALAAPDAKEEAQLLPPEENELPDDPEAEVQLKELDTNEKQMTLTTGIAELTDTPPKGAIGKGKPAADQRVNDLLVHKALQESGSKTSSSSNKKTGFTDFEGNIHNEDEDIPVDKDEEVVEEKEEVEDTEPNLTPTAKKIVDINRSVKPNKSPAQLRRIEAVREKYKSIVMDDGRTMEDILTDAEANVIHSSPAPVKLRDQSLVHSSLVDFEKSYVDRTFRKDIISMVHAFASDKALNLHITNATVTDTSDQFNDRDLFVFEIEDENQKKHKLKFNVPRIDKDGFMKINGDRKILKKQWLMIPIAKIKPDTVFVSSNYNKVIIYRQGTVLNHNLVIVSRLFREYIANIKTCSVDIGNNDRQNKDYMSSVEYDELANVFHKVKINAHGTFMAFYFNQKEIRDDIASHNIKYKDDPKRLPIAIMHAKGSPSRVIDVDVTSKNESVCEAIIRLIGEMNVLDNFEQIVLGIPAPKRRVYSRIVLQSKKVPLIVFLASLFGLKKIIEAIKNPLIQFSEKRIKGSTMSFIKFQNGFLYYPQYPLPLSLLFNGLTEVDTENYTFEEMESIVPYMDYIYDTYRTRNMIKGWVAFKELFLDPITLEVLRDYGLPTDFLEVFLYANDLLGDNSYSHETDAAIYRIRGFEVIPVELYKALAIQYQQIKNKGFTRESFTIPDDEIIKRLHKSFIMENYDSVNPVNELKSKSIVTFKGPGGINISQAFPLEKRAFSDSMMGVIGMSSVDSSGVGIVKQITLNPRIKSTRGYLNTITDINQADDMSFSQMATPEEAAIPFINAHDDPKRIGFASGQTKHAVSVIGSAPPLVGSGFEQSIIHKIGDTFAFKAKEDGVVLSQDDAQGLAIIEYKSGKHDVVEYGNLLNRNSNMYLGNPMTLHVKAGQKIKAGQVLTYNKEFFQVRGQNLFMTQGPLCHLCVLEGESTEEDSSDLTESFSERMTTEVVKRKQVSIGAKSNIVSYKKVGDHVVHSDPLMSFEESDDKTGQLTSILSVLGDVDDATLSEIARHTPYANETGEIKDMRVYWTCDLDDMSPSCRKFVQDFINSEKKKIKFEESFTNKPSIRRRNIELSTPYRDRIRGAEVNRDQGSVVIEYYIGGRHAMGPGDKLTYYSSLKSIVAHVIPKGMEPYSTFGDRRVDATLGMMSIGKRMTLGIYFAGTLGKVIYDRGKQIAQEYFEGS